MRRGIFFAAPLFFLLVFSGGISFAAPPLNFALAENHVDITTGFTGGAITGFGYKAAAGQVAVVLEGPRRDVIVRRKAPVFGAWVNRSWVRFKDVPLYYDYAFNAEDPDAFLAQGIGVKALKFQVVKELLSDAQADDGLYWKAFLRGRRALGFYPSSPVKLDFLDDKFFTVRMHIPANVPKGLYTLRVFLIRNGTLVHEHREDIKVGQVGFSSRVYGFAQKHGFTYALLCVFIAMLFGWLSNKIARVS